ncbi:MAG: hypothetical protein IPM39_02140 [Chloroflexi bacterium]|nr:hypothetical protein [Chloroflexota bacterium]
MNLPQTIHHLRHNSQAIRLLIQDLDDDTARRRPDPDSWSVLDWEAARDAPWGKFTAGDMLAAWVAHDILHLRQLVELKWANTVVELRPYIVQYAGEW